MKGEFNEISNVLLKFDNNLLFKILYVTETTKEKVGVIELVNLLDYNKKEDFLSELVNGGLEKYDSWTLKHGTDFCESLYVVRNRIVLDFNTHLEIFLVFCKKEKIKITFTESIICVLLFKNNYCLTKINQNESTRHALSGNSISSEKRSTINRFN